MVPDGLLRLNYDQDLDVISTNRKRMHRVTLQFLEEFVPQAAEKLLFSLLKSIESEEGDVNLSYGIWDSGYLQWRKYSRDEGLILLAFPQYSQVKLYNINFSYCTSNNSSEEYDPTTIRDFKQDIFIDPNCNALHNSISLDKDFRHSEMIYNKLVGAVLFKTNPLSDKTKYPWFNEILKDHRE